MRTVYHPLQTCEGANHYDSDRESIPKSAKPNLLVDSSGSSSKRFTGLTICIELRDHDICRMRNDRAQDSCDVSTREGNGSLGSFSVVGFTAGKVAVNHFNGGFKRGKLQTLIERKPCVVPGSPHLHHCVWNLPAPQRVQALVKTEMVSDCSFSQAC